MKNYDQKKVGVNICEFTYISNSNVIKRYWLKTLKENLLDIEVNQFVDGDTN